MCTGSYDGEIIVWNNSTEKALRKLWPRAEYDEGEKHQGLTGTHTFKEIQQTTVQYSL